MNVFKSEFSENIVIGALINDINLILEMKDLKSKYFTSQVNKMLYIVIKKLYKAGSKNIDQSDIYALIETNDRYEKVFEDAGGLEYLDVLCDMGEDKTIDDLRPHIDNIVQAAFRTELNDSLIGLQETIALSSNKSIKNIYKDVEGEMLQLKNKYATSDGLELVSNNLDSYLQVIDRQANKEFVGYPTFSPLLNKFVCYEKGECVIVSGLAKTGKSMYVINEVYNLCIRNHVPMIVLDTELSTPFFLTRLIARITNLPIRYIKSGKYKENSNALMAYEKAVEMIRQAPLVHKFIVGMSEEELTNEVKRMKIQMNAQILVYDYIKTDISSNEDTAERLQMAHRVNWLKDTIAGDLNLSVIALTQTAPFSEDLRTFGSNSITMYCSTIMYLVKKNKDEYEEDLNELGGNYKIVITNNRNGKQFDNYKSDGHGINILFNHGTCRLEEAKYQHDSIIELSKEDDIDEITINQNVSA